MSDLEKAILEKAAQGVAFGIRREDDESALRLAIDLRNRGYLISSKPVSAFIGELGRVPVAIAIQGITPAGQAVLDTLRAPVLRVNSRVNSLGYRETMTVFPVPPVSDEPAPPSPTPQVVNNTYNISGSGPVAVGNTAAVSQAQDNSHTNGVRVGDAALAGVGKSGFLAKAWSWILGLFSKA